VRRGGTRKTKRASPRTSSAAARRARATRRRARSATAWRRPGRPPRRPLRSPAAASRRCLCCATGSWATGSGRRRQLAGRSSGGSGCRGRVGV
jgi:hypothetical protein